MIATNLFYDGMHAMAWEKAIALDTLKKAKRVTLTLNQLSILFIWHDNSIYAVQAQCPHLKLPLKNATITDHRELVCPFHKSTFDLKTGATVDWSPWPPMIGPLLGKVSCPKPLKIYATRLDGNDIFIDTDLNQPIEKQEGA